MTTDLTPAGEQFVIPGCERVATRAKPQIDLFAWSSDEPRAKTYPALDVALTPLRRDNPYVRVDRSDGHPACYVTRDAAASILREARLGDTDATFADGV